MQHTIQLIYIYEQVCHWYNLYTRKNVLRFNWNGQTGAISDEELLTIYLFCTLAEEKRSKKAMHRYILNHWSSWFPTLPSYATFNDRLNRLAPVFSTGLVFLLETLAESSNAQVLLGDSFPIITCSAKRKPKVAPEWVSKDYCASKDLWYHGIRLHALAQKSLSHSLPIPCYLQIETAAKHDLEALRPILKTTQDASIFLDKAYCDQTLKQELEQHHQVYVFTPEKVKKGESTQQRQHNKAYRDLLSTAVAKVRQPIEALFSWLDRKTGLQNASSVRSQAGLLLHVFGKVTAAFMSFLPIFKP